MTSDYGIILMPRKTITITTGYQSMPKKDNCALFHLLIADNGQQTSNLINNTFY